MSDCVSGVHVLPENEESWNEADADALMAACLDKCLPCQAELSEKISRQPNNEAFGKLFTTLVITGATLMGQMGIAPKTGTDLWPGAKFERPTRDALAGVKFSAIPQPGGPSGAEMVAVGWPEAAEAARILARMPRQDRLAVLGDVMDMVVGVSSMRESGVL